MHIESETVWLSLLQMAELFERDKSVISRHLNNIFKEGELVRESVVANFATTAADGKIYKVNYYNLDTIISVGYRVNSKRGIQFRQWATQKLKDYLIEARLWPFFLREISLIFNWLFADKRIKSSLLFLFAQPELI